MPSFIDNALITVISGDGGNGMVHFRKEKFVAKGGPDGGDGGRGGDVILRVNPNLNTLFHFQHKSKYQADGGVNGTIKQTGASAKPLVIYVPPGTIVYDDQTGHVLGDLVEPDQELLVAKGGRGGRGNVHFKNSRNQAPRIGEKGEPGKEQVLRLELKVIADIGLVGVPNAGKSTFLASVTNATPKIANYPFTTLVPNLGVALLDEDTSLVLADIPGLIEGAHQGIGLGHEFLRHIQRTRVLIHILDGLAEDPIGDFYQINAELALFDESLKDKPQIVAFNKMDLPDAQERWPDVQSRLKARGFEVMDISAVAQTNVRQILFKVHEMLGELPEAAPASETPVYKMETDPNEFTVEKLSENEFRVKGASIERAAAMTYWEHDQSVRRFQRILETIGIDAALREIGIEQGHTVHIGEYELEWQD